MATFLSDPRFKMAVIVAGGLAAIGIAIYLLTRPLGMTVADQLVRAKAACAAKGGTWDPLLDACVLPNETKPNPPGTSPTQPDESMFDCAKAHAQYAAFIKAGDNGPAFAIKTDAHNHGCSWA